MELINRIFRPFRRMAAKTNYIFLCSHMRGYTSLFSHILGSHHEIKGYSEMHQSYQSTYDLIKLRYKLKIVTADTAIPKYLFDKLLHNQYKLSNQIVRRHNVHPVIMLRKPEPTLKSIINMGQSMTKVVSWYKDEEKVAEYYQQRLLELIAVAKQAKGKCLFIAGENLIEQPDMVLGWLSNKLQLSTPLQKEYETFTLTGKLGAGDPSDHIKSGTIIEKRKKHHEIIISKPTIEIVNNSYEQAVQEFHKLCQVCK